MTTPEATTGGRDPQARGWTRCTYLTARCPTGCESWLHPRAIRSHVDLGRCRRRPWIEDIDSTALVPGTVADLFVQVLPARHLAPRPPASMAAERGNPALPDLLVSSPVLGIPARRWALVAAAAAERDGADGLRAALTQDGFARVADGLDVETWLVDCPDCGDTVTRSGLNLHRARSTRCRWARAASEVRGLWADGWRDPVSVAGAPTDWTGLQARVGWRRRTRTVDFPRWVAVLLAAEVPVVRRTRVVNTTVNETVNVDGSGPLGDVRQRAKRATCT